MVSRLRDRERGDKPRVSASGAAVHDEEPSFRDQTSVTKQEIFEWAAGRGQLVLVGLAALVVVAFLLAFADV